MFTDEQKALLETGIIKAEGNMTSGDAHLAVNFPLLLEKGLDGLRAKVAERRSRINLTVLEDLHGEQFLKAIDIVLEAVSLHIKRFAALAREMAPPKPAKAAATSCWRWPKTATSSPTSRQKPSGRRCSCATSFS
jgi:pyruvate-formate lyase